MSDTAITALAIRRSKLEWTTLEQKKNRVEVGAQHEASLDLPAGSPDLSALITRGDPKLDAEVIAKLKAQGASIAGRLAVALPTEQILLRVVRLPSTEPVEVRGMAELQVDKFSPFPADLMAVSIETLEQKDGSSRVLIAAIQREYVEKLGEIFRAAELYPREVDVAILGWWRLLKEQGEVPAEGRHLVLVIDEHSTELIVTEGGVPVMFRALGSHAHLSPEESAAEIAEEVNYTLTTLETEWGAADTGSLRVWHWDASPTAFLERLKLDCTIPTETRHLELLPTLTEGLARRSLERSATMLDLAPPQWREAILARAAKVRFFIAVGSALLVWALGFAGFWGAVSYRTAQVGRLKSVVDGLKGPKAEVLKIKGQVEALERYSNRSDSPLECLMIVSTRLPTGVDLTSYSYKKYEDVNLRGQSQDDGAVYDFFKALESEPLFKEVKPDRVNQNNQGGKMVSQFGVTMALPKEGT